MFQNVSFKKYLLTSAIGFGLGGALWGWELHSSIPIRYPLTALGAILIGIFGGIGLSVWFRNWKIILKTIGFGLLGCGIGFFLTGIGIYPLFLSGTWFLSIFPWPDTIIDLIKLSPSLKIGAYWLNFAVAGILIGLFYALALKTKFWPMIWRGGTGFVLGSLIGPIIGNLIGNAFNSLFVSYLVTFSVIGIILGLFLAWGVYKNLKPIT